MVDKISIFEGFSKKKVLIVGDVMIDSYLLGKVERISPEAPVPIVSIGECKYRLGGAANVALNVAALGAMPYLCSIIGNDNNGQIFRDLLKDHNLPDNGIISSEKRKTTIKTRVISSGQHLLRIDDEVAEQITDEQKELVLYRVSQIIENEKIDVLIFEDYDKGLLSPDLIHKLVALCRQHKIRTCVDPKMRNFNFYKGVTLFKPNLKEFCEGCKIEKTIDLSILKSYAREFLFNKDIDILMITLSEYGVLICTRKDFLHFPAEKRDIVDVSGAGDTVISTASLLLASGVGATEMGRIANIAGGIVCEKVGVVPIDIKQLMSLV